MWKIVTAKIREEIYYSLTSHGLFLEKKRMPQRTQRHGRATLHWSAHPKREQDQMEKSSYGLGWQQKGIWYGSAKLNNELPQNVQNITWSHKLYRENYENLESRIDSMRKKLCWSKDLKRYIPKRYTITITIYNCDDTTQPYTQKIIFTQPLHSGRIWHEVSFLAEFNWFEFRVFLLLD